MSTIAYYGVTFTYRKKLGLKYPNKSHTCIENCNTCNIYSSLTFSIQIFYAYKNNSEFVGGGAQKLCQTLFDKNFNFVAKAHLMQKDENLINMEIEAWADLKWCVHLSRVLFLYYRRLIHIP